jgi:hypothetical protein
MDDEQNAGMARELPKLSLCFRELFIAIDAIDGRSFNFPACQISIVFVAQPRGFFFARIPAIWQTKSWKFLRLLRTRVLAVEEMERL